MPSIAIVLLAGVAFPIVETMPFRDTIAANKLLADVELRMPDDVELGCGAMFLSVDMLVRPDGRAADISIDGPTCASRRIEILREELLGARQDILIPAKQTIRYRFKINIRPTNL